MRKTSTYARKARRSGGTFNAGAFINTIAACRAYTDEPIIPGMDLMSTQAAATKNAIMVREEFDALKSGKAEGTRAFDVLANAVDVATIRAIEIAGNIPSHNPMLPILLDAGHALTRMRHRFEATGRMGLDGPAIGELAAAMDVYDEILSNSSPRQMTMAEDVRFDVLAGKKSDKVRLAA